MSKQKKNEPRSELGSLTMHIVNGELEWQREERQRQEALADLRRQEFTESKRKMMERTDAKFRVLNSHFSEALQQQKNNPDLSKLSVEQIHKIDAKLHFCLGLSKGIVPCFVNQELRYKPSEERTELLEGMLERCRFITDCQMQYYRQSLLDVIYTHSIESLKTKREVELRLQRWRKELDNPRHENRERAAKMILLCQEALKRF